MLAAVLLAAVMSRGSEGDSMFGLGASHRGPGCSR